MILTDNIISYIPQRAPFVLIDKLINAGKDFSKTIFDIQAGHLFVCNDVLTEPGIIENMAQTAAAGIGYNICKEKRDAIGFIGALKSLIIDELPAVGERIITEVAILHKMLDAYIAEASVFLHGRKIASCKMSIVVSDKTP